MPLRALFHEAFRRVALASFLLPSAIAHAAPQTQPMVFRMAEYDFLSSSREQAHWAYPVFLTVAIGKSSGLNAWLRQQSLQMLANCSSESAQELLRKSDREVVESVKRDPALSECGGMQVIIEPSEAFGDIVTFRVNTELTGQARPQHGVGSAAFDLRANSPIEMESLFKPDALAELNAALAERIERDRPNCRGRSFAWHQVSLRPPGELFIEFPFNPADMADCGDSMEVLSGPKVSAQLLRPAKLRPERQLSRVR